MDAVKKLYLQAYCLVMALYVFFNKGIAYSFLAEALWAAGFIVLFLTRKQYVFGWDKRTKILAFFLFEKDRRLCISVIVISIILVFLLTYKIAGTASSWMLDIYRFSFPFYAYAFYWVLAKSVEADPAGKWFRHPALAGVALLPFGSLGASLDMRGVGYAALAGMFWGLYLIVGKKTAPLGGRGRPRLRRVHHVQCFRRKCNRFVS